MSLPLHASRIRDAAGRDHRYLYRVDNRRQQGKKPDHVDFGFRGVEGGPMPSLICPPTRRSP
jgi:hypothetical protein